MSNITPQQNGQPRISASPTAPSTAVDNTSTVLIAALDALRVVAGAVQQGIATVEAAGQVLLLKQQEANGDPAVPQPAAPMRSSPLVAAETAVLSPGPKTTSLSSPALNPGESVIWQSTGGADPRLSHATGVASGVNWECRYNTDKENVWAQFGPYLPTQSGFYRVEFDLWSQSCWARCQVTKNTGSTIIWDSHVKGDPNPTGGAWRTYSSPNFIANPGDVLEFRVSWHTDVFHDHSLIIGQSRLISVPDAVTGFTMTGISYDLAGAVLQAPTVLAIDTEELTNGTSAPQTTTFSGSQSVTNTSGWQNATSVSVTVTAGLQVGVPMVASGSLSVAVQAGDTYTVNGSTSYQTTMSWSSPISVPANSKVKALAVVSQTTITVPYTMTGIYRYASGRTAPGTMAGTYTGTNAHDLNVDVQNA